MYALENKVVWLEKHHGFTKKNQALLLGFPLADENALDGVSGFFALEMLFLLKYLIT